MITHKKFPPNVLGRLVRHKFYRQAIGIVTMLPTDNVIAIFWCPATSKYIASPSRLYLLDLAHEYLEFIDMD